MENLNIFELMYEQIKVNKPIRLIEFFAGYGSQALALKYLGANFEHYRICEWAINSIIAYADLHRNELPFYNTDFSKPLTKEEIAEYLYRKGVSIDYNKPATLDQLKRTKEDKLRLCYNAIQCTRNLVDISRVKGKDLEIEDTEMFTYLLTYSFPCQDLSLAGKGAGMERGSGTRSGLLWEVERILSECENKPQILLMENVTQVHGAGNDEHFKEWQLRLEEMGYQSYWEDMSAVDFGIPQTRNRTFMISILGDYNYKFPKQIPLKLRLKDLLESNVDEKYYLSEKMIDYISATGTENFKNCDSKINKEIARPLTTEQNKRAGTTNYICDNVPDEYDLNKNGLKNKNLKSTLEKVNVDDVKDVAYLDAYNKNVITDGTSKTILSGVDFRNQDFLLIKNATKKGYLEAEEGDGIDISSRMESHRGTVQKDKAQTITTMGGENVGVVVKKEKDETKDIDYIGNYSKSNFNQTSVVGKNGIAPTVTENHGQVTAIAENVKPKVIGGIGEMKSNGGTQYYQQDRIYDENCAISVTTSFNPNYQVGLRIRKLTPKECFRLQGLKDEDIDLIMEHQTSASAYHLARRFNSSSCLNGYIFKIIKCGLGTAI